MKKVLLAAALAVSSLLSAAPAQAQPHVLRGYHFENGLIHPKGHPAECLTAASASPNAELYIFGCGLQGKFPGDVLQIWNGITIGGTVILALAAHPDLIIGGIPGNYTTAKLIYVPLHKDVPLFETMYMTGKPYKIGGSFIFKNYHRERLYLQPRGRQPVWASYSLFGRRGWISSWTLSKNWIEEDEL